MNISVCIPTHNRIGDLKKTLDSVLSLTSLSTHTYEILVTDDVGLPSVEALVLGYKNAAYFNVSANPGQFNSLNVLLAEARFDWLLFLHDDDILVPEFLCEVTKAITQDVDIVFVNRSLIDENDVVINKSLKPIESIHTFHTGREVFNILFFPTEEDLKKNIISPMVTGLFIKKSLATKVGGFDQRLKVNSDSLFLNKVFIQAEKVCYIHAPLLQYRFIDNSERSIPSKKGTIYEETKKLLAYTLEDLKNYLDAETFSMIKKEKAEIFYESILRINGPITWISLRYEGPYLSRLTITTKILIELFNKAKSASIIKLLLLFIISLLPQFMLKIISKMYLRSM